MMIRANDNRDEELKKRIMSYSGENEDYWSFRGKAAREHAHAYLQYPAMMVPSMQGELIGIVREWMPEIKSVLDPFMGSGTVMTESMLQGLNFIGQDVNPLAVLICQTKKGPFFSDALLTKMKTLLHTIDNDKSIQIDIDFPNIFKWFREDVAVELSRIRRGIKREPSKWSRNFFWMAFAETIRLTSNSRTSTFKLHIRPRDEIRNRNISPINIFEKIVRDNFRKLATIKDILEKRGFLKKSRFSGSIKIRLGDSAKASGNHIGNHIEDNEKADLLVTSPPYGDNNTTVPYGQYSYLPLQWIDLSDIEGNVDQSFLSTTREIDKRSLGGLKVDTIEAITRLGKISAIFSKTIEDLRYEPDDRKIRVAAFCRDLNKCIDPILDSLKPNACMCWTIGNRMVGKRLVPMDDILSELLLARGAREIAKFHRRIPSKRMAVKNNIASTMRMETILLYRKGNA